MNTILLFLIIVTGYSAVLIILQYRKNRSCPNPEDLKNVLLGKTKNMDDALVNKIVTHFGICKNCREMVNDINNSTNETQ